MNKRHYEHTLPNIRGSLSNTYERSTKKLEEAQKQGQEQDGSQQQPHAPVQVAGKPRKKEEASQQAEKKPRTRKPSITPKM